MSSWRESLSKLIAVPKSYYLQTFKTETGFQIVEPKEIPPLTPIVWSPLRMFFHQVLVDHLLKSGAKVEGIQQAPIFRKSNGFISNDYFTLSIRDQWTFSAIMTDDFHPALINMIEGSSDSVFFSRAYYDQVSSETNLLFQELPVASLRLLGSSE